MMRMSQPGETYVYGSHIFSLYDWGRNGDVEGLIEAEGDRRLSYYAFRMGIRALQGGKAFLASTSSSSEIATIATRDEYDQVYILMVNDQSTPHKVKLDVSQLGSAIDLASEATLWEFSESNFDQVVAYPPLDQGLVVLTIPAQSSLLIQLNSNR